MKRTMLALAAILLGLMAAMLLKGQLLALPEVPAQAEAGRFDTHRAFARLQRLLAPEEPHPADSAAGDRVRGRLVAELRALGLQPQVTDDFACNSSRRTRNVNCARVRNVLVTIGPREGRHLLLVSHYDSTPAGPGAADDGIGVAAMLEVAAQLRGERLDRPVTLLFNEGEEAGLIGARSFLERHPLAARVDALLNFESRGVEGPAIMFETSRPNGGAIAAFSRAVERPVANSLTTDFYRMIPNSTDVAVFEERPWTILNFAIVGNETRYHSPGDTLAALDLRSLGHMGEQALALARAHAAGGTWRASGERLYTDLLGSTLVVLPAMFGLVLLALLLCFFLWLGWRRRSGLARAATVMLAALTGSAGLAWAAQALMAVLRPGDYWRAFPDVVAGAIYSCALLAGLAALLLAPNARRETLRASFWLLFVLVGAGISLAAPGAAILFLFPPLPIVAGVLLGLRLERAERVGALLSALLLFLMFAPLLHLIEVLLDFDAGWIFAPVAALILLPFLIELAPLLDRLPRKAALALPAAVLLAAWTAVAAVPAYSENRQQLFTIEYLWEQHARRGRWMVNNDADPLPSAFESLGHWELMEPPHATYRRWATAAPAIAAPTPAVELLSQQAVPRGRMVALRLRTGGAESVTLRAPAAARLRSARAGGFVRHFGTGRGDSPYNLRCTGRSCDGMTFELLMANRAPAQWTLIGIRSGLPAAARPLLGRRPQNARPQYGSDATIAVDRVRF